MKIETIDCSKMPKVTLNLDKELSDIMEKLSSEKRINKNSN